jgi:hypothetical protein
MLETNQASCVRGSSNPQQFSPRDKCFPSLYFVDASSLVHEPVRYKGMQMHVGSVGGSVETKPN